MGRYKAEIVIVGGGIAGLSAAIYLGRAQRDVLVVDEGKSMARWEPDVQNYLGFPEGIGGDELIRRGRQQARKYHARFVHDRITSARAAPNGFRLRGKEQTYYCVRLLLATGIFHIPPDMPGLTACLGHSMFFCKDCDGHRVQGKTVVIYGWGDEAVEYALGILPYSPCVLIVTDGRPPSWSKRHARYVEEYEVPVYTSKITNVMHEAGQLRALTLERKVEVRADALFTTRGDLYYNELARQLGARVDGEGELVVDEDCATTVSNLYAAGCVTPANCQMIIAAGQGATAAQAINRDLFEQGLASHSLKRFRQRQLAIEVTRPKVSRKSRAPSNVHLG